MSRMSIVHYPDERLRKKAVSVTELTAELSKIIEDMIETMYAEKGVGLAANQVGLPWDIAVIDEEAHHAASSQSSHLVYINARMISQRGRVDSEEGCLSIPEYRDTITRAESVTVSYRDRNFQEQTLEAQGLLAIILQHEIDHLSGKLYIDHLSPLKRNLFKRKYRKGS